MRRALLLAVAAALAAAAVGLLAAGAGAASHEPRIHGRCRPVRHGVCHADHAAAPAARRALDATLDSARVRRGLGLPSLKQLLGHGGAAAERAAERRLFARGAFASSVATAAAKTVAGVSVTTEEHDRPAEGARDTETLSASERLRRGRDSEYRSLKIAVAADVACPDAHWSAASNGFARGLARAVQRLLTVQTRGRYTIETNVTLELERTVTDGEVDGYTRFVGIQPYNEPEVTLVRTRRVVDRRSGRVWVERPLKLDGELMTFWPELWIEAGSAEFNDFVNDVRHDPADDAVPDQLMNEDSAWKTVNAFVAAAAARSRAAYARAERYWETPNQCLTPSVDIPDRLQPGQTVTIRPSVTSKRGDPTSGFGRWGYWGPFAGGGLTVNPDDYRVGDSAASATYTLTAPSHDWPADRPLTLRLEWHSKAGVAEIDKQISETPTDLYFKTSAVTGSMDYEAHYGANRYQGDDCTVTGDEQYALSTSPTGTGEPTDGSANASFGLVLAPDHLHGSADWSSSPCALGHASASTCHDDLDDDGLLLISIAHADGAATAGVQISAFGRDLGDADCHDGFADDWVHGDDQFLTASVPWSQLTGTAPFTISASDHVDDGQRSVTRQVAITLQPVDASGRAL